LEQQTPGEALETGKLALPPGVRVLLVEDNEVNRLVASNMLEELGCPVEVAGDGREALDALEKNTYSLVFMDLQMPEIDGLEATRRIRRRENGNRRIPIVAMTANAMQSDREKCLAAGMDGYLAKPFSLAQVRALVEKYCGAPGQTCSTSAVPMPRLADKAGLPIFDVKQMLQVTLGKIALIKRVVPLFEQDTLSHLDELERLLAQPQPESEARTIERLLHTLKGEARNVGAERLGEYAYQAEQTAKRLDYAEIRLLLPVLREEFQCLREIWQNTDWDNLPK
jgi:CheY-like chemotaxis protein